MLGILLVVRLDRVRLATLFALNRRRCDVRPILSDTVCKANPGGSSIGAPTGIITHISGRHRARSRARLTTTSASRSARADHARHVRSHSSSAICC